jgi:hypothetical protein
LPVEKSKTTTMLRRLIILLFVIWFFNSAQGQKDTTSKDPLFDTSIDYDELFSELDAFLDSLLAPRTYKVFNVAAGTNFFDYSSKEEYTLQTKRQIILAPSFGYYHKSGLGVNISGAILNEKEGMNPYQLITTLSYDYLGNMNFVSGISATHYFTKDSLNFYTSPLKNELYAYFTYRRLWFKPSVAVSYGWGSSKAYEEREEYITSLRLRQTGYTRINTQESITDFNIMASVRHDFYWLNVLSKKDYIRLSPQISFTSGTQSFGFNQTSNTYGSTRVTGKNELYRSENVQLDDRLDFQPLSLTASIKSELSIGKFFIQPVFLVNYYFPVPEKNISTGFTLNTGVIF